MLRSRQMDRVYSQSLEKADKDIRCFPLHRIGIAVDGFYLVCLVFDRIPVPVSYTHLRAHET